MKAAPLLDSAAAAAVGFDWLTQALRPRSEYGLRVFRELRPFRPGQEPAASARARRIAGCAAVEAARLDAIAQALTGLPDVVPAIARAGMGDVLDDAAFLELQRFCDAATRIDALLEDARVAAPLINAGMRTVAEALEPGRLRRSGFYLADAFASELASTRTDFADAQAAFEGKRGRLLTEVARRLEREDVSAGELIVMRADVAGQLPPGLRILREAPTYWLCAPELDDATLAALQRRDAAADAVAVAEERVRMRLSGVVAETAGDLGAVATAMGELDVMLAAARFARDYDCTVAEISNEPALEFEGGRFLPLAVELAADGRAFAPIAIDVSEPAVLTGPNMGGKSVCLRTCGAIAVCAAFGLPVPAKRSVCALFDHIAWLGVGSEQERLGGLLSTFAREVVCLRDALARDGRLLLLADEFARTTTPLEGKALLVALLRRLRARRACGLAATHLAGVASAADARHFAVRGLRGIPEVPSSGELAQVLAALAASMDYTIAEVGADDVASADALALASLLGLDATLVDQARALLGGDGE